MHQWIRLVKPQATTLMMWIWLQLDIKYLKIATLKLKRVDVFAVELLTSVSNCLCSETHWFLELAKQSPLRAPLFLSAAHTFILKSKNRIIQIADSLPTCTQMATSLTQQCQPHYNFLTLENSSEFYFDISF